MKLHLEALARYLENPRSPEDVTQTIKGYIQTYAPESADIERYIAEAVRLYGEKRFAEGLEAGQQKERDTNPALKRFGEALAAARQRDRANTFATMLDAFQKLTEGGANATYAFYQAIDAAEGPPRKR